VKRISPPQSQPIQQLNPAGETTMTIRLPDNFLDYILAIFGKKRNIIMLDNLNQTEEHLGLYVTVQARK